MGPTEECGFISCMFLGSGGGGKDLYLGIFAKVRKCSVRALSELLTGYAGM